MSDRIRDIQKGYGTIRRLTPAEQALSSADQFVDRVLPGAKTVARGAIGVANAVVNPPSKVKGKFLQSGSHGG